MKWALEPAERSLALLMVFAALLAVYAWASVGSTLFAPGLIGFDYNAPGTDWMVMYAASDASLSGHLPIIFDGDRFTAHLNELFAHTLRHPLEFRPWIYPPSFLLLLAPFSILGFVGSYLGFQAVSGGLMTAALLHRPDHRAASLWIAVAALLSHAASINVIDGQCGFLVAALLIGAVRMVSVRPIVAGVLLGLLSFKPQFAVLAPVAFLAAGQWRALAAAAATVAGLVILSALVFGPDAWIAWFKEMHEVAAGTNPKWVQLGRLWGDSVFACAVLAGFPAIVANALQAAALILGAGVVALAFRSRLSTDVKLAVLLAAVILAAPHSASYDKVLLVVAAGLWLAAQPRPWPTWAGILVLGLWLSAMIGPPIVMPLGRLLPVLVLGFLVAALRTPEVTEVLSTTWRALDPRARRPARS